MGWNLALIGTLLNYVTFAHAGAGPFGISVRLQLASLFGGVSGDNVW